MIKRLPAVMPALMRSTTVTLNNVYKTVLGNGGVLGAAVSAAASATSAVGAVATGLVAGIPLGVALPVVSLTCAASGAYAYFKYQRNLRLWYRGYTELSELRTEEVTMDMAEATASHLRSSKFAKYWGTKLRIEMNYPRKLSEANRLCACDKLIKMWRTELPALRLKDQAYYTPRVLAVAFTPSEDELVGQYMLENTRATADRKRLAWADFQ